MKKTVIMTGLSLALLTGVWMATTNAAEPEVVKGVKEIADQIEAGKDPAEVAKKAAEGANDIYLWMELLSKRKPGDKGGLGIGPKVGVIQPDGIEAKLLGMKRIKQDEITKYKAELKRLAAHTAAVAAVSKQLAPKADKGKKTVKLWNEATEEMHKGSKDLWGAIDKGDLAGTKKAVTELNNSCVKCHNVFRD